MIERLRNVLAPVKTEVSSDRGYRRLLRWAALPVTDRRWAAPLSALALGFGLFVGVAIGPGAAGTFAGGVPQIIEIPSLIANSGGGGGVEEVEEPSGTGGSESANEEGTEEGAFTPVVTAETGFEAPEEEAETPVATGPPDEEEPTGESEGAELTGTVVHVNTAAGSYTVVEPGGVMSAIHAATLPKAGTQIKVPIETLANGTLGEAGKRVKTGTRSHATLAGIVTAAASTASAPSYTVSNRGSSVLIRVHPDPAGAVPALPALPALGAYTSVTADIDPSPAAASSSALDPAALASASEPPASEPPETPLPTEPPPPEVTPAPTTPPPVVPPAPVAMPPSCAPDPAHPPATANPASVLWQRQASGGGAPFTHGDFAGIVTAVCPSTGQLMLSADDIRESGLDLLFSVPTSIDTAKLTVGDSILASADIATDGALSLTGLASDERRKGADDARRTQGDLVPKKDAEAGR